MPKYVVEGADRATGENRVLSVDAPSQEDARSEAQQQGVMVSVVRLPDEDDDLAALASAMSSKMYRVTQPTVSYRSPGVADEEVPEYHGLVLVGWALRGLGGFQVLFVLLVFCGDVFVSARNGGGISWLADRIDIVAAVWGVVWFGLGECTFALRDVLRSYFRGLRPPRK